MNGENPTLLIVDDEPFNLEIIAEFLSDYNYQLVMATNGDRKSVV